MQMGVPYDSDEGRAIASALTAIMCGKAYAASAEMAASKGPFVGFAKNREPMLRVMSMHRDAAYQIDRDKCPTALYRAAFQDWVTGHGQVEFTITPIGRRLSGNPPASLDLQIRRLVAALAPIGDAWPVPHYGLVPWRVARRTP